MHRGARILLTAAVAATALGAGVYVQLSRLSPDSPAPGTPAALARIELPDLTGKPVTLAAWQGKVLVINFWATWCAPCRREIPGLIGIQRKHAANGVQVVGIAVDQVDKVREYAKEIGINYPVLVAGMDGSTIARDLGNRTGALPFTVVLDRTGKLVKSHLGLITEEELDKLLDKLREKLPGTHPPDAAKSG
jgi:thiol-disulfide isomerase/thioredoxin